MLVGQGIARRGMIISSADGETQRDLSWLDFSMFRTISNDGKTILFEEEGNETTNYTVYVRDVDGSPALPIGEGYGADLSRDKKWALAIKLTEPNHEVWLFPVGPGEARRLSPPSLAPVGLAAFLSDGKSVVYSAREGDHPARMWLQDFNGGAPRAISSEGITGRFLSPDDKWVLVYRRELGTGKVHVELLSIEDGKTVEIAGLRPPDLALGWTSDGQLYVATRDDRRTALHVEKLNPHTGARTPWRDLATAPIGGILPDPPYITPDGTTYGFDYRVRLSDLYTVTGVH
jgi:Tol biopolymer transport system component